MYLGNPLILSYPEWLRNHNLPGGSEMDAAKWRLYLQTHGVVPPPGPVADQPFGIGGPMGGTVNGGMSLAQAAGASPDPSRLPLGAPSFVASQAPPPAAPEAPAPAPPVQAPIQPPPLPPSLLNTLASMNALPGIFNPQRHTLAGEEAATLESQGYSDVGTTAITSEEAPGTPSLPPFPVLPGQEVPTLPAPEKDLRYHVYRGTDGRLYRQAYIDIRNVGAQHGSLFTSGTGDELRNAKQRLDFARQAILDAGEKAQTGSLSDELQKWSDLNAIYLQALGDYQSAAAQAIPNLGTAPLPVAPPAPPATRAAVLPPPPVTTAPVTSTARTATTGLTPAVTTPSAPTTAQVAAITGAPPAPAPPVTTTPAQQAGTVPQTPGGSTAVIPPPVPAATPPATPPPVTPPPPPIRLARSVAPLPRGPGGLPVQSTFKRARARIATRPA